MPNNNAVGNFPLFKQKLKRKKKKNKRNKQMKNKRRNRKERNPFSDMPRKHDSALISFLELTPTTSISMAIRKQSKTCLGE